MLPIIFAASFVALTFSSFSQPVYLPADAPVREIALVPGAGLLNGEPGIVLEDRLETAMELYFTDKVDTIFVSGDNSTPYHDEPSAMRSFLQREGVRGEDIIEDEGGISTFASCEHAADLFEGKEVFFVSQEFHMQRGLFLCDRLGVDVVGVISDKREYDESLTVRERYAMVKAVLELYFGFEE